jgi:hypothetical protein
MRGVYFIQVDQTPDHDVYAAIVHVYWHYIEIGPIFSFLLKELNALFACSNTEEQPNVCRIHRYSVVFQENPNAFFTK